MINFIQIDSIPINNFFRFNSSENDYLPGEDGDGMNRQNFVLGIGRRSY